MIGLDKMGANMATRLLRDGHRVVAYNLNEDAIRIAEDEGAVGARTLDEVADRLHPPRAVWGQALLSGVLANWLVGMAALFATMGRSIVGKYVPILLVVSLFVAANFQHSPANMGYFSIAIPMGIGSGWLPAIVWNIIPVGIGNMLGGGLLVALPFWFALRPDERASAMEDRAI